MGGGARALKVTGDLMGNVSRLLIGGGLVFAAQAGGPLGVEDGYFIEQDAPADGGAEHVADGLPDGAVGGAGAAVGFASTLNLSVGADEVPAAWLAAAAAVVANLGATWAAWLAHGWDVGGMAVGGGGAGCQWSAWSMDRMRRSRAASSAGVSSAF